MYIVLQITLCLLQRTTACKLHYLQTYQQLWARLFVEKTLLRFTFYEPQFCFYNCELFSSWFDLPTPPPQKKNTKCRVRTTGLSFSSEMVPYLEPVTSRYVSDQAMQYCYVLHG